MTLTGKMIVGLSIGAILVIAASTTPAIAHAVPSETDGNAVQHVQPEQITGDEFARADIFERNREPPRATLFNFETRELADRGEKAESGRYLSLDGTWKFHWSSSLDGRPRTFFEDTFDVSRWNDIAVPGNVELQGYGDPLYLNFGYPFPMDAPHVGNTGNAVSSYRRDFHVPAEWLEMDTFVSFGAVNAGFYVWVNGTFVGYSESSKDEARFRLTDYLRAGRNQIAVQVLRATDGAYLEDMDYWRLSGIERSVELYAEPRGSVTDQFIVARYDAAEGTGVLDAAVDVGPASGIRTVAVDLLDGQALMASLPSQRAGAQGARLNFSATLRGIEGWTAETPKLYRMVTTVRNADGTILSVTPADIGFRTVDWSGSQLKVNGSPITVRGVNLHEFSTLGGHVMDDATVAATLRQMKALNINAIRTSHYPSRPLLYKLADQYGFYIVDEANVESHGYMHRAEKDGDPAVIELGHRPEWLAAHLARAKAMVERDKNHPSVIAWSLGNEAGGGPAFSAMYDWIKARDASRPVQYQAAGLRPPFTDLIVPFYPSAKRIAEIAGENPDRPVIMSEYAHGMGNSMGGFADSWEVIRRTPNAQGGFIWDWIDQGLTIRGANGQPDLAYGGDFSPMLVRKDIPDRGRRGNFLANGLVDANMNPHPHAFEVAHVLQPVHFSLGDDGNVRVINRHDFLSLDRYDIRWSIYDNGALVEEGSLPAPRLAPGQTGAIDMPLRRRPAAGTERFLRLELVTRDDSTPLLPKNHVMGWGELKLTSSNAVKTLTSKPLSAKELTMTVRDRSIDVQGIDISVTFDKVTGTIESWVVGGEQLIVRGLQPNFWRPTTDNDAGWKADEVLAKWREASMPPTTTDVAAKKVDGLPTITATQSLRAGAGRIVTKYVIGNNGIDVEARLLVAAGDQPLMPRFGMAMLVPNRFSALEWYGRGPFENYVDRKASAMVGRWRSTPWSMVHHYSRPQETGNVTDVRWLAVSDPGGRGVIVRGQPHFDGSALAVANGDLDWIGDPPRKSGDLRPRSYTTLNIDLFQMGVGGDNSWGARPRPEYLYPATDRTFRFRLEPLIPGKDPGDPL